MERGGLLLWQDVVAVAEATSMVTNCGDRVR
jgi:hypothetical protein